jgi:glycosyltransferase involved in cell wall biosynthesis
VPSRFLQQVFAGHGVDAAIIPNVVDLDVFRPAQAPSASPGRAHVVITRSLEAIYGIDTAIRAAAILRRDLPQLRLSIAGSGPEREPLAQLVAELGLSDVVRFTGRLEVAQVAALYAEADVALNPSRVDNTPNSLLEAAACGVPIVSTNVGGVPHLVEHGRTAWVVEPDSPEQMARGVARVFGDAALRATLREQGLALARSCAWGVVGGRWLALYDDLARSAGGALYGATAR